MIGRRPRNRRAPRRGGAGARGRASCQTADSSGCSCAGRSPPRATGSSAASRACARARCGGRAAAMTPSISASSACGNAPATPRACRAAAARGYAGRAALSRVGGGAAAVAAACALRAARAGRWASLERGSGAHAVQSCPQERARQPSKPVLGPHTPYPTPWMQADPGPCHLAWPQRTRSQAQSRPRLQRQHL